MNADVNQYTSDFSSTEDLVETNGTGAAAQSVGGVDDAYKFTTITGTGQMFANVSPFSGKGGGNSFRVQADVYLPSTNAEIDKVRFWTGYGAETFAEVTTTDAWTSIDETLTITSGSLLRFQAVDGTDITPTTTEANVFYLKNIVVTQTTADGAVTTFYDQTGNGLDATNATESEQPLVVSAGTLVEENSKAAIDFDGVDDKLGFASNLNIGGSPSIIGVLNTAAGDIVWRAGGSDYWYFQSSQIFRYRNGDFDATWINSDGLPVMTGSQKLVATYKNSTSVELAVDGASIATKSSGTGTDGAFNNIGSNLLNIDGVWQELIIFNLSLIHI